MNLQIQLSANPETCVLKFNYNKLITIIYFFKFMTILKILLINICKGIKLLIDMYK